MKPSIKTLSLALVLPLSMVLTMALTPMPADAAGQKGQDKVDKAKVGIGKELVTLKKMVKVEGNVVRLGDLFRHVGEKAEISVAYAPEPGKRASFDARWLYRVARTYGLKWRPINDRVRAVVVRDSQIISRTEIVDAIRDALAERGVDPDSDIEMSNRLIRLHVPAGAPAGVGIEDMNYQPRTRRFTAIISAPADSPDAKRFRFNGRVHATTDVPVLIRRVLAGEQIKKSDVKWVKVRSRRVQPSTILQITELVGMTPRRGLRANYPILTNAVRRPILVEKGSLVTMVLQTRKMTLTAQGKALDHGSDGDVIRIKNTQSNKTVEAEVIGHGRVAVKLVTLLAMK